MTIRYTVAIDRDDDGTFDDVEEAITADVLALRWSLGMVEPYAHTAPTGTAVITVRNRDGSYTPELDSLSPGRRVRISSDDGTTTRTHFTGYLYDVRPVPGTYGPGTAELHLRDGMAWLEASPIQVAPGVGITADAMIARVLDAATIRPAALKGYCVVNLDGYNVIDGVMLFGTPFVPRSLEPGKSRFAYVGDTWPEDIPAADAIRELAEAERGRFHFDRAGRAVFLNRHHTLTADTPRIIFKDDMTAMTYAYGADVINRVMVTLLPREIGPENSLLWALAYPQRLVARSTRRLVARFRDVDRDTVGALTIIEPVAGVHFTANERPNGAGQDVTDAIAVNLTATGKGGGAVEVRNPLPYPVYLTSLTLRGTPLLGGDPLTLVVTDGGSSTLYGQRTLSLELAALTSVDEADALANYELKRRKTPRGVVTTLSTTAQAHPNAALSLQPFDPMRVVESATGHTRDYLVTGEAHTVDQGGTRHRVTWTLEPDDVATFTVINVATLDGPTVLAPF